MYQPFVSGDIVYVSGQLPMVDGVLLATGLVGSDVSPEDAKALAQRCALNGLAAAATVA
jgi:enamine deaminase RidA (YjgF/YER057c/UK114 family)